MAERDYHLDGLRGLAAVLVVFEHASALLPVGEWKFGNGLAADIAASILNFPFRAGNFAVFVFFVLSGLVVSKAAQGKPWRLSLASRYARLTIPMVAASLMAWALLASFPGAMSSVADTNPNYWTTNLYQHGAEPLWDAISEPLWGAYLTLSKPELNPVLWSMKLELWASLGIFTFHRFVPEGARRWGLLVVGVGLFLAGLWAYLAFVIGMGLYEQSRGSKVALPRRVGALIAFAGLIVGILASMATLRYAGRVIGQYAWFDVDLKVIANTVGAFLVVFGIIASETSRSLLVTAIPLFLGRISYACI